MNVIRVALCAVAVCLALPAIAVAALTSYAFGTQQSVSGNNAWDNSPAGYNINNGTDYGNMRSFMSSGASPTPVNVTAWASTGGAFDVGSSPKTHFNGTLQTAYVSRYGNPNLNELAVTSRPVTGNTAELDGSNNPNTGNNQHAIDNAGAYESLLFTFQSAVTLNSVSIGFPQPGNGLDSDATVLVYTGSGDPTPNLSMRTYADLLTNNWKIAGNLFDMVPGTPGYLSGAQPSSKYWMVGAFMNIGGNQMIAHDSLIDTIKISGITVTPRLSIPEPGSLALLGIASLGLLFRRKKGARTV